MGMFDTYDNLNPDYVPDNSSPTPSVEFTTIKNVLPRNLKNIYGKFLGYTWHNDEHFSFDITTDDIIEILEDSIVYTKVGESPDNYTVGTREGQQAYNTADGKSWTYVGRTDNLYIWIEDEECTYPVKGDKSIVIHSDMTDKYAQLTIVNFRGESVLELNSEVGESKISLTIDEETSKILIPDIYHATLKIVGENDCIIKNRFIISIN